MHTPVATLSEELSTPLLNMRWHYRADKLHIGHWGAEVRPGRDSFQAFRVQLIVPVVCFFRAYYLRCRMTACFHPF
jgi:hypothetical protein